MKPFSLSYESLSHPTPVLTAITATGALVAATGASVGGGTTTGRRVYQFRFYLFLFSKYSAYLVGAGLQQQQQ